MRMKLMCQFGNFSVPLARENRRPDVFGSGRGGPNYPDGCDEQNQEAVPKLCGFPAVNLIRRALTPTVKLKLPPCACELAAVIPL